MHSIEPSWPGLRFLRTPLLLALAWAAAVSAAPQDPSAASAPSAPPAKQKKVWTNDDVQSASPAGAANSKSPAASPAKSSDASGKLAELLRAKLEKLTARLQDTEKELNDLKNFQAGEGNGNAARQLHKGCNTEPIPEQIQKLEEKRQQLEEQISAVYDEARKSGILPGQLR